MKVELTRAGASWTLDNELNEWLANLPIHTAAAISAFIEEFPEHVGADSLVVPAEELVAWPEAVAVDLGLPPNTPFPFDVRLSGAMGKPGAAIAVRWLQPGRTIAARDVTRDGPWLASGGKTYRISAPIFYALRLLDEFSAFPDAALDDQFRCWARIREALGESRVEAISDSFLRSFRVVSASGLTFSLVTDERGEMQLDPVLLTTRAADEGDRLEHVRALPEVDEPLFAKRLDQLHEGASAFPLNQGLYVVADEALQKTLAAVRKLRQAPAAQRKRAAMHPEAVIRELMGLDESAPTVFIETERYADRVLDLGAWSEPTLPWIKIPSQDWSAPVSSGIRLNGVDVPLERAALEDGLNDMREALAAGQQTVSIGGVEVPATTVNLNALERLHDAVRRYDGNRTDGKTDPQSVKNVLIIETNFEDASFTRATTAGRFGRPGLPGGLKTSPKPHQCAGIEWLQRHWIEGSRGAMLCDDMGLGKTYQALAFCAWLREMIEAGAIERRPLLIVAPVGLLRNWEQEIDVHFLSPGLGTIVRAYGEHLKALRRGRHLDGTAGLDMARLVSGDVVLANYEAVSDYQLSFGAIPFAVVILDEAQKIKSPKARMTHAVKGLNTEFTVAMTGTPVENRLADLWCIADAVQPGALLDLKDFSARYESPDSDVQTLRNMVWQDEEGSSKERPKLLLRRLKTDKLDGLPAKHEHVIRVPMPAQQLEAYQRALATRELAGPQGTLGMIHALRRISLHPMLAASDSESGQDLDIEQSARMCAAMEVLDKVAERNEKALVFLESLDLQEANQLPMLLKRRYGLTKLPMVINGEVGTEARQARVDAFQRERGFDVMLLSPKAGGVGITLTAANHVIHLSRWWNPAVEDQCSDRVYRIGQTLPVHIYYPLAVLPEAEEYSFDVQLQLLMERKRKLAQNLLAAPAFTKEDYQRLLDGTHGRVESPRKVMADS